MEKLAALETQLAHSVSEKARLEGEVELCTQKLERAEKLIQVCLSEGVSLSPRRAVINSEQSHQRGGFRTKLLAICW